MKILITGGFGFLGQSILNSQIFQKHELLAPNSEDLNLKNRNQIGEFFFNNKIDWIINCAVRGGRRNREETAENFYNNVISLSNLLPYVNDKTKLITFSSGAERYKLNTFYGESKKICSDLIHGKDNIKNLRIYNIFGPLGMKDSFVYSAVEKCLKNKEIVIWEDHQFDIYHVDNLILLINTLIDEDSHKYQEIDCVHEQKHTLSEIAEMIKKECKSKSKIIVEKQKSINYIGEYKKQKNFTPVKLKKTLTDFIQIIKNEKA